MQPPWPAKKAFMGKLSLVCRSWWRVPGDLHTNMEPAVEHRQKCSIYQVGFLQSHSVTFIWSGNLLCPSFQSVVFWDRAGLCNTSVSWGKMRVPLVLKNKWFNMEHVTDQAPGFPFISQPVCIPKFLRLYFLPLPRFWLFLVSSPYNQKCCQWGLKKKLLFVIVNVKKDRVRKFMWNWSLG